MISEIDRLRNVENILAEAAQLQLHNQIAIANLTRKGDALCEKLDRNITKYDALLEKREVDMEEFRAQAKRDRKEMNKAWGDLANKLGTVAEDVVASNIRRMATEDFAMEEVEHLVVRGKRTCRQGAKRRTEYDIVCAGPGKVIVAEVKSTPTLEKIHKVPERLADFFDFYPEYEGREPIGIFASWSIDEDLLSTISKAGLYGIAMGDETMAIVARPAGIH